MDSNDTANMIERFQGVHGRRRLKNAMAEQRIVAGDQSLAEALVACVEVAQFAAGDVIIRQGEYDSVLYLIISGRVEVLVNDRRVAYRGPGTHVGEMAVIDPAIPRSATVIADRDTIVARIGEPKFSELSSEYSELWRGLALELSRRLDQRKHLLLPMNSTPVIFVGSSSESLPFAKQLAARLQDDEAIVNLWSEDVFVPSSTGIEALEAELVGADFAVLVLSGDDTVSSRGRNDQAPRDNVVFELGLFMGALTRPRTIMLVPRTLDTKIPTDLLGVTSVPYTLIPDALVASVEEPARMILQVVSTLGTK